MAESQRCVLIDGHSLAYRAFYALPPDLSTSSGQQTNAVYGFTSMLIKILEDLKPDTVVVAFDKGKPQFRTEVFAEYKAHRKPMPDELREQMGIIHALLDALGIPTLEEDGFEADDVLATITGLLPQDAEVFIVTGDRDALQLVDERVKVVANRKGITDIVTYDPPGVKEKYGVEPAQIVDYLALKGDASDNIPGVPGIGEKTAASLIASYGSLDEVYGHLAEMKPGKVRKALEEHRESAYLSRDLARMRYDVPLAAADPAAWALRPWDDEKVERIFASLEFRKLLERLRSLKPGLFPLPEREVTAAVATRTSRYTQVEEDPDLDELVRSCARAGELSLYAHLEGEGYTRGGMRSACVAVAGRTSRFDLEEGGGRRLFKAFLERLGEVPGLRVNCHRGKDIMVQCRRLFDMWPSFDFDVELASYLVNPSGVKHDLDSLAARYLGHPLPDRPPGQMGLLEDGQARADDDVRAALAVEALVPSLEADMGRLGLRELYEDVEMPLEGALAEMEATGIRLDVGVLAEMQEELERELAGLEERAHGMAGEIFNLNSPQQLARILFEVLELPPVRRTKTGYATDVSVLNALREKHPIAEVLLRYRELSKLLNTYVAALPRLVDPSTGRLHACFNQTVTATGRLSSSNPNLQNIPIRTSLGKKIRKAFMPTPEDGCILTADYSQIELRVLAHLSGDEGLRRAFLEGLDIHASTASEVFDVPLEEVTSEHRRKAKAINFGIIYGISPFGLSEQLGIDAQEAEAYIDEYFGEFPGVRRFLDEQVQKAAVNGYVLTILGRRREIPELLEGNVRLRRMGERLAFNTPIQGSAADIIKLAMVRIHRRLRGEGLRSRMILQVHDELVFDVERDELETVRELVRAEMEGACELDVPLKVDMGAGPSWYDAK